MSLFGAMRRALACESKQNGREHQLFEVAGCVSTAIEMQTENQSERNPTRFHVSNTLLLSIA
jgi:hypothetical protein